MSLRSPVSVEAERLYHEGLHLVDIAQKLKVKDGTVRRWKSTQHWDANGKKKQPERSGDEKRSGDNKRPSDEKRSGGNQKCSGGNQKRSGQNKRGAGRGTKKKSEKKIDRRVGRHVPTGTLHALTHGGYTEVFFDVMTEEERAAAMAVTDDPESALLTTIRLLTAREYRLMKIIMEQTGESATVIQGETQTEHKRIFDGTPEEREEQEAHYKEIIQGKVENGERMPGRDVTLTTQTENRAIMVTRLEAELTRVQNSKAKAIQMLAQIRAEREKQESGGASDLVRLFVEGLPDMEVDDG